MSNEALRGTTVACHDGFFTHSMKPDVTLFFAQRNFYSPCTSLHFIAVGSHCGSAATIESLLMDLCIGFSTPCVPMHMISSYVSRWAPGHNTIGTFWVLWVQGRQRGKEMAMIVTFCVGFLDFILRLNHIQQRGLCELICKCKKKNSTRPNDY